MPYNLNKPILKPLNDSYYEKAVEYLKINDDVSLEKNLEYIKEKWGLYDLKFEGTDTETPISFKYTGTPDVVYEYGKTGKDLGIKYIDVSQKTIDLYHKILETDKNSLLIDYQNSLDISEVVSESFKLESYINVFPSEYKTDSSKYSILHTDAKGLMLEYQSIDIEINQIVFFPSSVRYKFSQPNENKFYIKTLVHEN
tara:strand:- start:4404 stop:4997 length:594 start_codon:yes stop_codon:yes gene_type:complete